MGIDFLLQTVKLLHVGEYTDKKLDVILNFINNLDNEKIIGYLESHNVLQYQNDLELFIEVMNKMITIFEEREEYEKCEIIFNKINESLEIIHINHGNIRNV